MVEKTEEKEKQRFSIIWVERFEAEIQAKDLDEIVEKFNDARFDLEFLESDIQEVEVFDEFGERIYLQ